MLRREQVDVIVALTHLTFAEDRLLAERFPEIDVIVGGHEHFPIAATANRTFISKAGSDAKFVARIDIAKRRSGLVERFYELIPITAALEEEPKTAAIVNAYESKLGAGLDEVVADHPRAARRDGDPAARRGNQSRQPGRRCGSRRRAQRDGDGQ